MGLTVLFAVGVAAARQASAGSGASSLPREGEGLAQVVVHPGWAEVTVRRQWRNAATDPRRILASVPIPGGGLVTGLSTSVTPEEPWRRGWLLSQAEARRRYRGPGGRGPAALMWWDASAGAAQIVVDAIAPQATARVEYRILLQTVYAQGRHRVQLPWLGSEVHRVAPSPAEGRLFVDDEPVEVAMAREGVLTRGELALELDSGPPLAGDLAVLPLSGRRHLLRYRFDLSRDLAAPPQAPRVVVVLDRSRSRDEEVLADDRQRIAELLEALGDEARVEIILFDRRPEGLFGRFVPASHARDLVDRLSLERRHGSHLDRALALAATRFAEAPAEAERRLVILTDGRMRAAFDPQAIAEASGDALVHVVLGASRFGVDQAGHAWTPIVEATGGLIWVGSRFIASDEPTRHGVLPDMSHLVRPARLREPRVIIGGAVDDELEQVDLEAGEGLEALRIVDHRVPWVELRGRLWSRPVRLRLRPDPRVGRRWAALALRAGLELTAEERRRLAHHGGALSEHTSFLVVGTGHRAEPEAVGDIAGQPTIHRRHRARPPRVRMGHAGSVSPHPDVRGAIQAVMARVAVRCGLQRGAAEGARVWLETTLTEIVDVGVSGLADAAGRCVVEELWREDLPMDLVVYGRRVWSEDLGLALAGARPR